MGSHIIVESATIAATDTNVLQSSRLQTVPSNGTLEFEIQASDNVAANHYLASIQLPDGSTPLNATRVPAGATAGLGGIIDDRLALKLRFRVSQGGHCVFNLTEVGDAECAYRVVFRPGRRRR